MMVEARLLTIREKDLFNSFIATHPKGHVLQSWEWGEVKRKTGWEPRRILVTAGDEPRAAISILKRRLPVIGKYIFYAPRGPVVDPRDQAAVEALFGAVTDLAKKEQGIFLKIDPDVLEEDPIWSEFLHKLGFQKVGKGEGFEGVQPRFVFRLDISGELEDIFQQFHQKTRYNIRLAQKKGVVIDENCSKADLPIFYQVLKETTERDNFMVRSYSYFEDMWNELVEKGLAKLFIARYEGKVIAGTLAFIMGQKAWYIYGASSNEHRNVMPNYLIQWSMIQWAKKMGCTMYDFRGVPGNLSEDNPLYGLYRFKKGFNGDYVGFIGEYDLVYQPLLYHFWNWAEPKYHDLIRQAVRWRKR